MSTRISNQCFVINLMTFSTRKVLWLMLNKPFCITAWSSWRHSRHLWYCCNIRGTYSSTRTAYSGVAIITSAAARCAIVALYGLDATATALPRQRTAFLVCYYETAGGFTLTSPLGGRDGHGTVQSCGRSASSGNRFSLVSVRVFNGTIPRAQQIGFQQKLFSVLLHVVVVWTQG